MKEGPAQVTAAYHPSILKPFHRPPLRLDGQVVDGSVFLEKRTSFFGERIKSHQVGLDLLE